MKPKSNNELLAEARAYLNMAATMLGILESRMEHGVDVKDGEFTQKEDENHVTLYGREHDSH